IKKVPRGPPVSPPGLRTIPMRHRCVPSLTAVLLLAALPGVPARAGQPALRARSVSEGEAQPSLTLRALKVTPPPADWKLAPFYKKHVSAGGLPVVGSEKVSDFALREAAYLIGQMLAERPDLLQALIKNKVRF